jgi:PAS domain S-box-containing protein
VKGPDGQPTGFSVELVRKAAERRGVQLQWIFHPTGADDSLPRNLIDLWPLITITPERKHTMHFTPPYMEHEYYLIVRENSRYLKPNDLARSRIAHFDGPLARRLFRNALPAAVSVPAPSPKEIIEAVCRGQVDAGFLEEFYAISTLAGGPQCTGQPLRLIWLSNLRTQLAIGSTFAAGNIADDLRDEITTMGLQNELKDIMSRWDYYSPQNLATMNELLNAGKERRGLIATATILAVLFVFALFSTERIRRQRNRIRLAVAEREEVERNMREWERRFRDLLQSAQLVAIIVDLNSGVSFCNDYTLAVTGWARDELIGRPAKDVLEIDYLWERVRECGAPGRVSRTLSVLEGAVLTKDGDRRWIQWTGTILLDTHGGAVGFAGLGEDITELKRLRTEAAIRESEERFTAIFQQAAIGVGQADLNGVVTLANDYYHQMLQYPAGELIGQSVHNITHPDDIGPLRAQVDRLLAGELTTFTMEKRYSRKDGEVTWARMHKTLVRDENNRPKHFIAVVEDINEQKKAEAALRESEERFRRVFEEGPLGLALVGKDYHFQKVNNALCQMLDYPEAELTQKSFVQITHPDDVRAEVKLAERLFNREIPFYRTQMRYLKKTGEIIWISLTASMIHGPDGEPLHGLAMVEDITEAKRIQEEALARQKLESIGVLAGGIAHDFNNLLGGILVQAESIGQDLPEGSSQTEELHRIKEAAIRGSEIVRELMIYSGQDKAELEPVDVGRLVEEMLGLLKLSVSKHAVLKTDLPKDLPAVRGNGPRMRQLVMNLVINASEAIGETEGEIRVVLSRKAPEQDLASNDGANLRQSGYLRLEVSDTGSGMTEETQARVFDPFFTTKFAGRGLGLSVVQSIVNSHGGTINVVSALGRGTTFYVDLPCIGEPAKPDNSTADTTSENDRISGATGTVLLVEDEATLRDPVSKMLRKHGFSVIEAGNGSAALDLVRIYRNSIEVILLDLTIPGAPSSEVVAEAGRIRPGVTVVLMSAYSREMVPPSLNVPEVKGFIRKPFQTNALVHLLRDAIAADRSATPASRSLGLAQEADSASIRATRKLA